MIIKEFYDVVIVGTSLAPLAAGALLSRRGLRVLVVGNGELEDDNLLKLFNTITSPLVTRIFEELGVTHMVRRKLRRPDPLFQVILPGARIDVGTDREAYEKEIDREFGHVAEDIKLLDAMLPGIMEGMEKVIEGEYFLPPDGLIEKKRIDLLLRGTPFGSKAGEFEYYDKVVSDPAYGCFLRAVAASNLFLEHKDLAPGGFLFLTKRMTGNCAIFEGGPKALKKILHDKIDSYGGEVRSSESIEEVSLKGRKVTTIRLAGKDSLIGCDFLISGVESECLGAMLTHEGRSLKEDILKSEDMAPTGFFITTTMKVKKKAIPEAMASNIIAVFDCGRRLRESNYLWAEIENGGETGKKDVRRIALHYILDRRSLKASPAYSKDVLKAIITNLGTVIPFLEDFIVECIDPVERIMKSHFTEDPVLHLSRLMPSLYEYRKETSGPFIGLGHKTGIKNVYRVGGEVCPSLGEDGLWLAALGAARIIASQKKGKTRLRRRIMFT
ncbi:MAG: hypothetical protein ABIJ56_17475 [Pseudomonadota bacterium]